MKRFLTAIALVLALPLLVAAQAKPAAVPQNQRLVLEYVDGNDFSVVLADMTILQLGAGIFEGDDVPIGATIKTGKSTIAELKLTPNGTIVKLAKSTTFTVTGLASTAQDKNAFAMVAGKVRAVAAKGGQYEIRTQAAVCGVRGTDFALSVEPGAKALLMVSKGLVDFQKIDAAGAVLGQIPVGAGQAADAFGAAFEAFKFSAEQFAETYSEMGFQKLLEIEVPGNVEAAAPTEAAATDKKDAPTTAETTAAPQAPAEPTASANEPPPAPPKEESPLMKWLREALGMELGSVTINEMTYAKAVVQPNINLGKVKLGLYLPIIYSSNLFDPTDWYHPEGNDEWSFGTEYWGEDNLAAVVDTVKDVALKIKYFEFGRQLEDPFFVKVGNLKGLTLGHGLVMRDYANDTEFPAVRRVGFNLGVDAKFAGFEAIVNDLASPEIFGARVYLRPIPNFKLAFGLSTVADIAPASSLSDAERLSIGDPMLLGTGLDLDLPIVTSDFLAIRFFADAAATLPYLRESTTGGGESGLRYDLVLQNGQLKNWGATGGLIGRILFIDLRLEYRYFTGVFRPSFFDSTYDRKRAEYALAYKDYLEHPETIVDAPSVMGIYGEGGFSILKDKLSFKFGYMWPWSLEAGTDIEKQLVMSNDELHAALVIKKGLIPIVDVAGSIFYDRRGLAKAIADGVFEFFDESTVFGGEVIVPVPKTPNLDLAVLFATVPVRNDDGSVSWKDPVKGIPYVKPSISIETRLHF